MRDIHIPPVPPVQATPTLTRRTLLLSALSMGGSGILLSLTGCSGGGTIPGPLTPGNGGGGATPAPIPTPTPSPAISPSPGPSPSPTPTPSGSRIERFGYIERGLGRINYIASIRTDGSEYRRVPTQEMEGITHIDWSRDGRRVAFQVEDFSSTEVNARIFVVNADGTGLRYLLRGTYPKWHADGRRLAYVHNHKSTERNDFYSVVDAVDIDGDIEASTLTHPIPTYTPFFTGPRRLGTFQYANPQWISDTADNVLVSMAWYHGYANTSESAVEDYASGLYLVHGFNNENGQGESIGLGNVSPDGSFTYNYIRNGESVSDRVERSFLVKNGTVTDLATVPWGRVLRFSPDGTRVLYTAVGTPFVGIAIYDFRNGEFTRTPLPLTQIVSSWFYE
jgi:hypothetical protein